MGRRPQLVASRTGARVEDPVRRPARNGLEEIAGPALDGHAVDLLRAEPGAGEVPVGKSGHELVADDCLDRAESDDDLAPAVVCGPVDGFGRDLWLEDRWDGLRMVRQLRPAPAELRRVH